MDAGWVFKKSSESKNRVNWTSRVITRFAPTKQQNKAH
jgi:hypothetical protein